MKLSTSKGKATRLAKDVCKTFDSGVDLISLNLGLIQKYPIIQ
jgi:hypothetical protein